MATLLKNLYSKVFIEKLSNNLQTNYKDFKKDEFKKAIFTNSWENFELKQRMRHIAKTLYQFLPFSYKEQIDILKRVKQDFKGLKAMIFQDFVEVYGLDDFEVSMEALEVFTIDSSSEFAIRQFILKYEDETIKRMKLWAKSQNEHIRRLASEGSRPRLPWAIALPKYKENPEKVFKIIELLKNDSSKYVQKSVANSLNDISKDNPNLVINFLKNNLKISKELDWICKHGSRTLLKAGNEETLELFGLKKANHIAILDFNFNKNVNLEDYLNFSFELNSEKNIGKIRVEYAIYYLKSNQNYFKKVFMISQNEIKSNSKIFVKKQIIKDMTTRKNYKGKHFISLVINGEEFIKKEFYLI
ncbi:DNA alkylation repair protein [Aliarcobacter cryaerophilus ATCC 43158]|uniref:3-methyladenine DNA glycosylase n=1 Tax=Aliarcobacter cryaerophilus ATCC 43158 TaxID=1032070 RepID=A0AAD0TVX9_9BACT|nr:DNA alkylation repair protein [Aliarcobacter cryaerophilus]AYJ80689.1 3-methyladenine DNA glycosylase [Aliarcobacter cryaerophilus ATCC 43158]PRM99384.1 DNA alkylation repair protein [Aliarcobacter cryaerophilus]QCZ23020.1 DNA alkylation repair protein [Aliarcobacter cryaerophilus ATCC 43158]